MCGIAGAIALNSRVNLEEYPASIYQALQHRGPDKQTSSIQHPLMMTHLRLAIQDLSDSGSQPMDSANQRFQIVFNGEIYNFKQLRGQLQHQGYQFRGGSDTEVMLQMFESKGIVPSLSMLDGMFAFAVFDRSTQEVILVRDRMGEKPLYYGFNDDMFFWASELSAIQSFVSTANSINRRALSNYLKYGYVPTPDTPYNNIYKLPPASYLRIPLNATHPINLVPHSVNNTASEVYDTLAPKKYWSFHELTRITEDSVINNYDKAVDQLDKLLINTIEQQMISDVPIGAFLSGGIDSSLVASIMQDISPNPIKTFTIGFNEKDYNEADFARRIAQHIGSEQHVKMTDADECMEDIYSINRIFGEPFANPAFLASLQVSKLAKQHVTVCLSGDGGDELFCGYNRYTQTMPTISKIESLPSTIRSLLKAVIHFIPANLVDGAYAWLTKLVNRTDNQTRLALKLQKLSQLLSIKQPIEAYCFLIRYCQQSDLNEAASEQDRLITNKWHEYTHINDFEHHAMAIDTDTYLLDDNLCKVDRTGMQYSLESRLPLLHHKVVEFAWRLPVDFKVQHGISKRILREVLFKRVPRSLIERPKMGFSLPLANWLRGPLKTWSKNTLEYQHPISEELLNRNSLSKKWQQHQQGKYDHSMSLWSSIIMNHWLERYSR